MVKEYDQGSSSRPLLSSALSKCRFKMHITHRCSSRCIDAQVPQQLREPFLEAVKAGRIRSMQNKLMPAAPIHNPGALLLGDAFNMRHPLTGQPPLLSEMPAAQLSLPNDSLSADVSTTVGPTLVTYRPSLLVACSDSV